MKRGASPVQDTSRKRRKLNLNPATELNLDNLMSQIDKLANEDGSHLPPNPPIHYVCAQGGGAKGAAYTGTVRAMDKTGILKNIKMVAGASAGAINAFKIGLGLTGDQIAEMIKNLNFQDLNDYSTAASTVIKAELGHSGENFYYWAIALIEHVTGDHNITFGEYKALCKQNPNLKPMIFKATNISQPGIETTFSAEKTPNVRIVDAVRASMSFPFAFDPWPVYEIIDGNMQKMGDFTDGGVLCNFPIEIFNEQTYEDPNYPGVDTTIGDSKNPIRRNPCSVGLRLCPLNELDEEITPQSARIRALKLQRNISHETRSVDEELNTDWTLFNMATAILKNKIGLNPEDENAKTKAYPDQTILIYTEEVGTLEFTLSPEKQERIEKSGENAWMQWFHQKQDPALVYKNNTAFQLDFVVKDENNEILSQPTINQIQRHFITLFTKYFSVILEEIETQNLQNTQKQLNSQRMKFYSYQMMKGIEVYNRNTHLGGIKTVDEILESAFNDTIDKFKQYKKMRHKFIKHNQKFVNEDCALIELEKLLSSTDKQDQEKALRFFKGKLSNIFQYMEKSRGNIIALAAKTGNPSLLQAMLDRLDITAKMMTQTSQNDTLDIVTQAKEKVTGRTTETAAKMRAQVQRKLRYDLTTLLNEISPVSYFKNAIESGNSKEMLPILLEAKINALQLDENNKNAFHYAIDAGDLKALEILCTWYQSHYKTKLQEQSFGLNRNTLAHFLIQNASLQTLEKLSRKANLLKMLVSSTTVNLEGVNAVELAAHLAFSENVTDTLENPKSLAYLRNLCATQGNFDGGNILTHVKNNALCYKQNKIKKNEILTNMRSHRNQLLNPAELEYEQLIAKLSAQECLEILDLPSEIDDKYNFLCDACYIQDVKLVNVIKLLCTKAYSSNVTQSKLIELMSSKYGGKTPLYLCAQSKNADLLSVFRSYNMAVDNAGPITCPSALTAAGRTGDSNTVLAIINSKPIFNLIGNKITRKILDDEGKTVVHWLAMSQDNNVGEALYAVLYTGLSDFHLNSSMPDATGNSPFFYLINNPNHRHILEALLEKGAGWFNSYKLDTYFDFTTKRTNGYTDLEWAFKVDHVLAEFISQNIEDKQIAKDARTKIQAEMLSPAELVIFEFEKDCDPLDSEIDHGWVELDDTSSNWARPFTPQRQITHFRDEQNEDVANQNNPANDSSANDNPASLGFK